jgi:hypothetical protein
MLIRMLRPVSFNAANAQQPGLHTMKTNCNIYPATPVNEFACAEAIGMSVYFLRKDRNRRGKKLIPFTKIGGAVRYDMACVHDVLKAMQHGGAKK